MRRLNITSIFAPILLFLLTSSARPQTFGTLTGLVVDEETGKSLVGVNVVVQKTVLGASTDGTGRFTIERVPPGTYGLDVSMMGYRTRTIDGITVRAGERVFLEIRLTETVITLDPIVVTAGRHPQSLSLSHQAVEVIAHPEIIRRQSRRMEEALFTVSGVHFNEGNISVRGSSGYSVYNVGSRVLLMIDGVPVLTSDLGAINWDMLPLLDVDRIEVVKGAGSALYGSSAMGGVVNVLTRSPSPQGRLQVRTLVGVYDQPHYATWRWTDDLLHYERVDLAYGRQVGPVGFRLGFSRNVSTGYMENSDVHQWNVAGRFVFRLPLRSRLDLYVAWHETQRGWLIQWLNQNRPFEVPPFNKEDEFHYQTLNLYGQYHLPLSTRFGLKFRVSHLVSKMGSQIIGDRSNPYDPKAFEPGQGLGWEIQGDWIPLDGHRVTFGSGFRWDVSGSRYFGDHEGYTLASYLQEEWTLLANLRTTLGLRWDRHVLIDEETNERLSPKVGINYRPFRSTTLRATCGSGFRAATVFEKYVKADYSGFNVIPNPTLSPERSWFWDVGFQQTFLEGGRVELSCFQSEYWDMIEPVIDFLGTIQFQNYVRARIRGLELATESWFWHRHIGLGVSLTWMDPRDLERDRFLPYRPRFTGHFRGTIRFGLASFLAEYRYASRVEEVEINPLDPRVPLKILDIKAQVAWRCFTVQAAVYNTLNYHYTQVERRMGEIRNFSLGLLLDIGE